MATRLHSYYPGWGIRGRPCQHCGQAEDVCLAREARELRRLAQKQAEILELLVDELRVEREAYENRSDDLSCDAGNFDGGSHEACEHCQLHYRGVVLEAMIEQVLPLIAPPSVNVSRST